MNCVDMCIITAIAKPSILFHNAWSGLLTMHFAFLLPPSSGHYTHAPSMLFFWVYAWCMCAGKYLVARAVRFVQ